MFKEIIDLNCPSFLYLSTSSRKMVNSSSDNSRTLLFSNPVAAMTAFAVVFPMPKMYVNAVSVLLLFGISTPATRAARICNAPRCCCGCWWWCCRPEFTPYRERQKEEVSDGEQRHDKRTTRRQIKFSPNG